MGKTVEVDMKHPQSRGALTQLVELMQLEERARVCMTRGEAKACIRKADAAKRQLWGSTEGTMS